MTKRLLVGTDGSPEGLVAVRWATSFAAATDAALSVIYAWRPPDSEIDPNTYDQRLAEERHVLEDEWCAPVREAHLEYHAAVLEGDPRDLLLVRAGAEDVDLVVIGARGTGGGAHPLHLGSVAHHLVHHIERPLAAIPSVARAVAPARIVVGVDGSPGSAHAMDWCIDHAARLGAEVLAVYSDRPLAEWIRHDDPRSWYHQAQIDCQRWSAPLRDAGLRSRSIVAEHEAVRGLTETAIREQADLIVVGTRGRGGFTGLRLGSTALKVLHRSGLPVVLVPTPGE